MLLLLAVSPFALLMLLPMAQRLVSLPEVSERKLTSAACYTAPAGSVIVAINALTGQAPLQAGLAVIGGVVTFIYGRTTTARTRASGTLGCVALLSLAAPLAAAGSQGAVLSAAALSASALLLPWLLNQLAPEQEGTERDLTVTTPELTGSSTPYAQPAQAYERQPAGLGSGLPARDLTHDVTPARDEAEPSDLDHTAAALQPERAPQLARSEDLRGWPRRRRPQLLDRVTSPAADWSPAPPASLGDGAFSRRRRRV